MSSPLKEQPLRLPGQSTDERLYDVLFSKVMLFALMIGMSGGMILSEWLRFFLGIPPNPILVTLLLSSVIVFSVFMIRKNKKYILQLRQGRDGEREVGHILEALRSTGATVLHDILGKDFNIDHVVISTKGIFTVETKTLSKRNGMEKIVYNGHVVLVNGRPLDRNPIQQSIAEAHSLRQILKESTGKIFNITPVVVFPGWFVEPDSTKKAKEKGVLLINPKALRSFIDNMQGYLSDEDMQLVIYHLTRYIKTTRLP